MYMEYITTTELRTKSPELIKALRKGKTITLLHRSEVVGDIKPAKHKAKPFDVKKFKKLIEALDLPPTTPAQREKIYREHLEKKYGKYIPRHK